MLDFPRIQIFVAIILLSAILLISIKKWKWYEYFLACGLFGGLVIQSLFLINYTSLVSTQVPTVNAAENINSGTSIILANVKMSNRNSQPFVELIKSKKPDLLLVMEVDKWWDNELRALTSIYPFSQHTVNEVAYGMVLYSKLPLKKVEVDYLTNKNVPSFESIITLKNGRNINFHAMHPVPPTHFKDLPDNAGQQENALKKLGKRIDGSKLPSIVAGDLNDVVWSYVDQLTQTKGILYDVRVGRGFYNSYNADNFLMRWPLDHVFVTKEFKLKKLERLPKIGSDHFPIFVELYLADEK